MKKLVPVITAFVIAVCGFYLLKHNEKPVSGSLTIPGGANEENKELRRAWERMYLADPATGEIPAGIKFLERYFAQDIPVAASDRSGPDWESRGPWNVGGRTRALALDVNDENRILAGGVSGGIWLSEDGGQTWARKTPLDAHPGCVSVAQDTRPGHTDTWYYLSGEVYGTSASGGAAFYLGDGLFKSTDNGETWSPVSSTAGGTQQGLSTLYQTGWRVITSPVDTQDVVYMATIAAIYRSANGGNTWTRVRGSGINDDWSYFTDVAISSTGVLYATLSSDGPQKGIWRSTNGTSWTDITPANFPATYDRIVIGINPNDENEVYFLGFTPGSGHYNNYIDSDDWTSLWKYNYLSGNGSGAGGSWEDRSLNLPATGTEFDRFAAQGGYDLVVRVQPGTNHVFVGGTNIYRSTDGFATANNTTHIGGYKPGTYLPYFELYPNHHPDIHDLLFLPSNANVMLSASDGGLHRTEDCNAATVTWTALNRGYHTSQFYTAIIDKNAPDDPTIIGGLQDNGNFFVNSSEQTAIWKQTVNGDGAYGAVAPNKDFYILSIQQGRVAKCKLDDDGNVLAYQRIDPVGRVKSDYLFINPLALDPNDADILYLPAGDRLYRQDQLGSIPLNNEWDSIATGWTLFPDTLTQFNDNNGVHVFSAIAVSQSNPANRVYLGTSRNKIFRVDNANSGAPALTQLTSPLSGSAGYINCIAIDPDNADHVVVVYSNYSVYSIYRSLNGGQNWQKVAGNLEANVSGSGNAPSIRWLSILPFPDGSRKYFCGTSVGLYSADSLKLHASQPGVPSQPGTQWVLEAPGLIGRAVVPFVETRASDGLVVAASHGIGLFTANFKPDVGTVEPERSPDVRVWPNPASDFAAFQITGASGEKVDIRLFDQKGKLVRQSHLQGENGKVDLSGLAVGTYLYELRGKGWAKSGKVVRL
ncbi:MAG: hypothetical protein EPGJADBJ_03139 [Saprospiraceae bacterium]|nr:hypothetical protein [Saprospiraceae bacterium]